MSTKLLLLKYKQIRWCSTKQTVKLAHVVDKLLTNNELKHRQHPGIISHKEIEQPKWLLNIIQIILNDERISPKVIYPFCIKLFAYLKSRHPPLETEDIQSKVQEVKSRIYNSEEQELHDEDVLDDPEAQKLLKTLVYNWQPIEYDRYTSIAYLIIRSVPEYSVLYKIFYEIVNYDKNFTPNTLFDFGSGVGTVLWAASQFWSNSIKECYCVDISREMNELAEYLIKLNTPQIKSQYIYYRQFFPASPIPTYDIVVSAYSLLELPNQKYRIETIFKLWRKTEQYLIIIEQGTNVGFKLVIEARDFILNYAKGARNAHVISPCPHDMHCPRYMTDDTPCNFDVTYLTLPIGQKSIHKHERYSYVVLKKGKRPEDDCKWPRIVRPIVKRSKHIRCQLCTASGKLEEHVFTTWRHGKNIYRCSRSSKWGDRLPLEIVEMEGEVKEENVMEGEMKEEDEMEGEMKEENEMEGEMKEEDEMEGEMKEENEMEGEMKEEDEMEGEMKEENEMEREMKEESEMEGEMKEKSEMEGKMEKGNEIKEEIGKKNKIEEIEKKNEIK